MCFGLVRRLDKEMDSHRQTWYVAWTLVIFWNVANHYCIFDVTHAWSCPLRRRRSACSTMPM